MNSTLRFHQPKKDLVQAKIFARRMITNGRLGLRSRILLVGSNQIALSQLFCSLGFDVATLPSGESADRLRPRQFDLAVVAEHEDYTSSLTSVKACRLTAHICSSLQPGGSLVYELAENSNGALAIQSHGRTCFEQHFNGLFSNVMEIDSDLAECDRPAQRFETLRHAGLLTIRLPEAGIAQQAWIDAAERDYVASNASTACELCRESDSGYKDIRKAA